MSRLTHMSADEFRAWLEQAKPGDHVVYYRGLSIAKSAAAVPAVQELSDYIRELVWLPGTQDDYPELRPEPPIGLVRRRRLIGWDYIAQRTRHMR